MPDPAEAEAAEAEGVEIVAKELGGKTKPLLMSESVRSASFLPMLIPWFFFELFLDNKDKPNEAKLEELLSLLSVRLNCF